MVEVLTWLSQGEDHLPDGLDWLSATELAWADRMRFAKRRQEYVLGRWTAKQAVAATEGLATDHATLRSVEILRASDGAPVLHRDGAPVARRLSMTDRAGWAVCTISPSDLEVGCDLELVEPRSAGFVRDFLTPAEQDLVRVGLDPDLLANLVWSAKESALKVLRTGLRRDTRSVEVSLGHGAEAGDRWQPFGVTAEEGDRFHGWWRHFHPFLLTVAAAAPIDPPASLVEPPPLAAASPVHSWLDAPVAPLPRPRPSG